MPDKNYITDGPAVWFVCPNCGYDKTRFPTRPEVWREYEADGTLTLRQDVVEVQQVIGLAERDVFMPIAFYLPACVLSGTMAMARALPWQVFEGILIGGAIGTLLFAVRYRTRVVDQTPAPIAAPADAPAIPTVTEAPSDTAPGPGHLMFFNRTQITYKSGLPVPDDHLWTMARAFASGVPFSKSLYTGETKCTSRPAFEALRDALLSARMAHMDGQDIVIHASGRSVLRQWAALDRPGVTI